MTAPACLCLVFLAGVLLFSVVNTLPQDFIFEKDREDCILKNGVKGRCLNITSCPSAPETFTTNPPVICGFTGKTPIVCCANITGNVSEDRVSLPVLDVSSPTINLGNVSEDRVPLPVLDISSPTINFECGVSNPRTIFLDFRTSSSRVAAAKPMVVGGRTAKINAWPWMALLGQRGPKLNISWFCGGVLLNPRWVLTAQHCFRDHKADVVRLAEHDFNSDEDGATPEDFSVVETVLHPDYNPFQAYNDLALLKLNQDVNIQSNKMPACLPWGNESSTNITGHNVIVTGWGNTFYGGSPSSTLQEVVLTLFPSSRCDQSYSTLVDYPFTWPRGIREETACAGDPSGGKDACQGDSGGPLLYINSAGRYTLTGIVSQGYGCGKKDFPGLYVNIRKPQYLAWIKKVAF
ncbi:venom protease [Procambarus clarkii]|uniref:venom protease n=1 Tax=Procambarus clarkii TaxID=6728 RepID=UPI0037431F77